VKSGAPWVPDRSESSKDPAARAEMAPAPQTSKQRRRRRGTGAWNRSNSGRISRKPSPEILPTRLPHWIEPNRIARPPNWASGRREQSTRFRHQPRPTPVAGRWWGICGESFLIGTGSLSKTRLVRDYYTRTTKGASYGGELGWSWRRGRRGKGGNFVHAKKTKRIGKEKGERRE
jgi:hypothetical protein